MEGGQVTIQGSAEPVGLGTNDLSLPRREQTQLSVTCSMNSHMYFIKAANEGKELPSSLSTRRKVIT